MVGEQDEARERAVALLESVERTLALPRPTGPLHSLPDPEPARAWPQRKARREAEQAPRPRNTLADLSDDQAARMLGELIGGVRKALMGELQALTDRVAELERKLSERVE